MKSKNPKENLAESLWMEINRALLKSTEVRTLLREMNDLGFLNYVSEFNLVLDMEKLVPLMLEFDAANPEKLQFPERESETPDETFDPAEDDWEDMENRIPQKPVADEPGQPLTSPARQRIDGKFLTPNQILFEEFLGNRFDEEAWLKQLHLRL
ncbi:MAG: hypothetical protein COV67_11935 [Nitrospinae bacterium CG11_big_fil_rev_8_21_14_0_20_56_8]|nr:MAG: hypothetical protein COV67_11935 [Nitrospinae bacterium CG11_big_fil_rev_8_21_14_0_20_56_8]